jgi:uncharacterized membrane protein
MTTFESTIEVQRPVRDVYDAWTQFEEFPRFMQHVEQVEQVDDTHLHWRAKIAGQEHEWDAQIIEQEPDRAISWQATEGQTNSGAVTFDSLDEANTRVTLRLNYEPEGVIETVGAAVGAMELSVKQDLEAFKDLLEHGEEDGSGWRGHVHDGREGQSQAESETAFESELVSQVDAFESEVGTDAHVRAEDTSSTFAQPILPREDV